MYRCKNWVGGAALTSILLLALRLCLRLIRTVPSRDRLLR